GHHVTGERGVIVGRGNDRDLVPQADEGLGQVLDVLLYPAGHVPGVRADHADSHGLLPLPPAPSARSSSAAPFTWPLSAARSAPSLPAASGSAASAARAVACAAARRAMSRSAVNTRWSMCQPSGCSAIPASKTRATCWVIAATFSRLVP